MTTTPVYIALDTETGGIGEPHSLLTAYFAILDEDLNILDELDLKMKPNDEPYVVTGEALRVNGINIAQHDLEAKPYKEAATLLYDFLSRNNPNGTLKLIPVGHNVAFDIAFLCNHTISKKTWNKFCGYRCLDTGTISMFLMKRGELPQMNASLGTLAAYYAYSFDAHTAKGDVLATIEVAKKFLGK